MSITLPTQKWGVMLGILVPKRKSSELLTSGALQKTSSIPNHVICSVIASKEPFFKITFCYISNDISLI